MMTTRALVLMGSMCLAAVAGCSDETGGGGGGEAEGGGGSGQTTTAQGTTTAGQGGAGGGEACEDVADCVACEAVLVGTSTVDKLCTCNGPPSSSDLFAVFGQCVCVDECAEECGSSACLGNAPVAACQECADAKCAEVQTACAMDQ